MPNTYNMSDVMISYSRQDRGFVKQLEQALKAENMEVWVDWEDIAPTADWWSEIQAGIEAAHTFVFVISPASVRSEVCRREIEHAVQHNKRIVPVLREEVIAPEDKAQLHPALQTHNWIYFREKDHFRRAFLTLCATLQSDLEYRRLHTRLLVRSGEWHTRGRSVSWLLRGDDLREAEAWLNRSFNKAPQPTEEQIEYLQASRQATNRLQRLTFVALMTVLLVVSGVALFAANQSQVALSEANLRATEERRAVDSALLAGTAQQQAAESVAQAATAQYEAADSLAQAATAQARVLDAQTLEAEARQASGNRATEAAIAQQSALTATVLQGNAQLLADQAKAQQLQADSARQQAEGQAELAGTTGAEVAAQGQATAQAANIIAQSAQRQAETAQAEVAGVQPTLAWAEAEVVILQGQATIAWAEAETASAEAEQALTTARQVMTSVALTVEVANAVATTAVSQASIAQTEVYMALEALNGVAPILTKASENLEEFSKICTNTASLLDTLLPALNSTISEIELGCGTDRCPEDFPYVPQLLTTLKTTRDQLQAYNLTRQSINCVYKPG